MSYSLNDLLAIYLGTNGAATKQLYDTTDRMGPAGLIATHLFRAHKNSSRAKEYRGSGRSAAYGTKDWSINSLSALLTKHAGGLGLTWGWGVDDAQPFHKDVFYIDLPTGQVSFHTAGRGEGPAYPGQWDGIRDQGAMRICKWILDMMKGDEPMDDKDIPRRIRVDQMTPAELAIREAVLAVEKAGAHPLLTEAVVLLGQAQEKVADFVDGQPIEQEIIALAEKHKVALTAETVRAMAAVFSTARSVTNG